MPQKETPWVKQGQLLIPGEALPIALDTPAWFHWLQTATRFCYSDQHTTYRLTARKEKRRNSSYWYGYLKIDRKLHNAYLGKAERLTQAFLNQVLAQLVQKAQKGGTAPHTTP